jgi:hypothetical protein
MRTSVNKGKREDPESLLEAPESVRELMSRGRLSRELGRSEARLELTEQAESSLREERDRLLAERGLSWSSRVFGSL